MAIFDFLQALFVYGPARSASLSSHEELGDAAGCSHLPRILLQDTAFLSGHILDTESKLRYFSQNAIVEMLSGRNRVRKMGNLGDRLC